MNTLHVKIELLEEVLGTASANPELMREFIASKRPEGVDEDEIANLPKLDAELQKATTVFHRTEQGEPYIHNYWLKGFFKAACGSLRDVVGTRSEKLKAYKKHIDGQIFVSPRMIVPVLPENGKMGICQRPLRGQTAKGERIALARSETMPAGTTMEFDIIMVRDMEPLVNEWLEYGELRGLGQWRNAGKGRFSYEIVSSEDRKLGSGNLIS